MSKTTIEETVEEFKVKVGMQVLDDMDKFEKEVGESPGVMDIEDMISERGGDFLRTALTTQQEELVREIVKQVHAEFWEDEDHAVGGYISRKDLKEKLLQALLPLQD